jgi:hypothetical protein
MLANKNDDHLSSIPLFQPEFQLSYPSGTCVMQSQVQHMIEKLAHLPPERLTEVEDFIDFLKQRDSAQRLSHRFSQASESSFAQVWDNNDDAIYDNL